MKKLLVIVASLLVAVSAHAQFGVIAGVTSAHNNFSDAVKDAGNVTQYHAGITYKFDLGLFAIQPSLIYNVKGSKLANFDGFGTMEYKNGYLELPVQLQVGLNLGIARIYGIAEPFIGYAITNSTSITTGSVDFKWEEVPNKLEYGVGVGAGIELIKHVQISARYFWNLGQAKNANWNDMKQAVSNQRASGIIASVALLF